MRLLLDENVAPTSARLLANAGHDVQLVRDHLHGAIDEVVLAAAVTDQRTLITFDKDFSDLVFRARLPAPPGVVLLRFQPASRVEIAAIVVPLLETMTVEGRFITVTRDAVRSRRLPGASPSA